MNRKILVPLLVLVVIVAGAALVLKNNQKEAQAKVYKRDKNDAVFVIVEEIKAKPFSVTMDFMGTIYPYQEVNLNSSLSALVKNVFFKEGDYARAHQVLAQLDDDLIQADYRSAIASLQKDSIEYAHYLQASSLAKGSVSENQLNQLLTQLRTAQNAVDKLRKQIDLSQLKAPFSGYITMKNIEIGSFVSPSAPFARISNLSKLKMIARISESETHYFRLNEIINMNAQGRLIKGRVIYISPRADDSHQYETHIEIDNSNGALKAGDYASFTLQSNGDAKRSVLTIPHSALLGSIRNAQVYVVKDDIARRSSIQVGNTSDTEIEVIGGLSEGDLVVTSGQINLVNGSKVQITKTN